MTNITFNGDDPEDFVRRIVREELADTGEDPWLNIEQAAEYTGRSKQRLHDDVHAGVLARNGAKGTAHRWRRSELDAYLRGTS